MTRAYDELRQRGYLRSRQGAGTVASVPEVSGGRLDSVLSPGDADGVRIDLTCAAPVSPPGVASAFERAAADLPAYLAGTGYFPSGLPALKERIASRYAERGAPTSPDQILVTNGALAASAVVARTLVGTGDRVVVETPGYPNTLASLQRTGARLVGTVVDSSGWDVDGLRTTVRQVAPTAAFLVPDFHNPTGALMSDEDRAELASALRRGRVTTVVDETLAEMALEETGMPAPMAAHLADCVTVGSASKAFWGGLRLGWIRAPHRRAGDLLAARLSLDLGSPLVEQLALVHLLDERDDVLAHHRARLLESRDALVSVLASRLPEWRATVPVGGLSLWCELPEPVSSALVAAAERYDVLLAPGPSFTHDGSHERYLRIPYTLPPETLVDAVERIALAWEDVLTRGPRRGVRGSEVPIVA